MVGFDEAKTVESVHAITVAVWLLRRCMGIIQSRLIGYAFTSLVNAIGYLVLGER